MDENTTHAPTLVRTGWILTAVLPTILFLLGASLYTVTARAVYVEIFKDFGTELPVITQLLVRVTASPVAVYAPSILLSAMLLWSAWKHSATTTLCLTVGSLASAMFAVAFVYISFNAPLASLLQKLT